MNSWARNAQTWKMMPRSSSILFFAGVFCLFASLVLIGSGINFRSQSRVEMIGAALIGGGFAMAWAYAGTRRIIWLFFVVGLLQFAAFNILAVLSDPHHTLGAQELEQKLRRNGHVEIVLIVVAYILFVVFFNREGARFFRTQTEVRLAGEIHRTLVPARHDTIGKMELFGSSVPSSEVGGDLFDIVRSNGSWHAYVADVSGHGVAAGILMSMIKSTASMQLTKLKKPADLLTDLNDVMQPFTSPANYLTFAYVGGDGGEGKPETFDFLGFTHISGKNGLGRFMVRRTSIRKRMRAKLRQVKQQLRERVQDPMPQTDGWLKSVVQGYFIYYYAVPGNVASLACFGIGCLRSGGELFAVGARNAGSPGRASSLWLSDGFLNRERSIPFLTLALPPVIREKNRMR